MSALDGEHTDAVLAAGVGLTTGELAELAELAATGVTAPVRAPAAAVTTS